MSNYLAGPSTGIHVQPEDPLPEYESYKDELLKQSKTLEQVVVEWEEGFGGRPSILEVDRKYGVNWRTSTKMKQRYQRRKKVYEQIKRAAERASTSTIEIAKTMDANNTHETHGRGYRSIDYISKNLNFFDPYLPGEPSS
jgi:hypothetical protein